MGLYKATARECALLLLRLIGDKVNKRALKWPVPCPRMLGVFVCPTELVMRREEREGQSCDQPVPSPF